MKKFFKNDDAATMIEYALIAGLLSVAAITAVTAVGTEVTAIFQGVADTLANV